MIHDFNCFCVNKNCELKFQNLTITAEKEDDTFVCEACGHRLKVVGQKVWGGVLSFDSLSPQEKRKVIHKRSMDHFKKTDKGDLANYKKTIIDDNKRMLLGK